MIRLMKDEDIPRLRELWKKVFGDGDAYLDLFFRDFYRPGAGVTVTEGGRLAAMGFLINTGVYNGADCLVTYAVAADPEFRNRGFGGEISRRLFDMSGEGGVICPAEESLFEFYSQRTGYKAEFFVTEESFLKSDLPPADGELTRIGAAEYGELREKLLADRPHIEFSENALRHERELCRLSGGGMFKLVLPSGVFCGAAERWGDTAAVKELLVPAGEIQNAAAIILNAVGGERIVVRTPAESLERAKPFAMGKAGYSSDSPLPWYGFAFD